MPTEPAFSKKLAGGSGSVFDVTGIRRQGRILDFDLENRPLTYWYDDVTTPEITAIAWMWYTPSGDVDPSLANVAILEPPPNGEYSARMMLRRFVEVYNEADMVTGHYIRKHDLPMINAALIEYGMEPLGPKLVSDTKLDLVSRKGLPVSQQALGEIFETKRPKVPMPQAKWRDANRLTPEGMNKTIVRVTGDVAQHIQVRRELLERGLLKPPTLWVP